MWIGIQHWDLKRVAAVINYHQHCDSLDKFEKRKRHAFALHVMKHDVRLPWWLSGSLLAQPLCVLCSV